MPNNSRVPLSREAADTRRRQLRQQLLQVNQRLNAKMAEFQRALRELSGFQLESTAHGHRMGPKVAPTIVGPSSREVNLRRPAPQARQRLREIHDEMRRLSRKQEELKGQLENWWIRGSDPKAQAKRSAAPQPRFPGRYEPNPAPAPDNRASAADKGTAPAKRRILAITLPRSRDAMVKRVTPLMKHVEQAMLLGEEDAELMAREVAEAVGRATVDRLKRWTDQLAREPSYENMEQVIMDMEIAMRVGADCEPYGTAAYERAFGVLIKASEQGIKDHLAWLKRYPNGQSIKEMIILIEQAQLFGSDPLVSKAQKMGWRAAQEARLQNAAAQFVMLGGHP